MDELVQPIEGDLACPAPLGFFPLRLVLEATGTTLELTRSEVLVGRHSECDVRLPLPDVSRRHCRFSFRDGQWHVRDLKSLNGVHVNGTPVVEELVVAVGDSVRIGGFTFQVESAEETGAAVASVQQTILYRIFRALPRPDNDLPQRKAS